MQQARELITNPWLGGPFRGQKHRLLFGAMYEDPAIETEFFPAASRVFCIASAGCTALALSAAGHDVTAVDVNPQQVFYAQARADGGPLREGTAERLLSRVRALFPALGWTDARLREFLAMRNPSVQVDYWQGRLDTKRWRTATDALLSSVLLGTAYRNPFLAGLPRRFGSVIRARLERTWSNHANNRNPYAWRFLIGQTPTVLDRPASPIRFMCDDAATYLQGCKPASFDAFSLSNILDGAPLDYIRRLCCAIEHAAKPGAIVVTRSFAEHKNSFNRNLAARDRSMIWGTVSVTEVGNLCSTL